MDKFDNRSGDSNDGQVAIFQTAVFRDWFDRLKDRRTQVRILDRLKRLAGGHVGDSKSIASKVNELRLHFGPGYRVYYMWQGSVLVILLNGGDKATQARDIAVAKRLAKEAEDGIETTSP